MRKYLYVIKTTFNDSIQYLSSLFFKFLGFVVVLSVLISLWSFIYSDGDSLINGYSFAEMIWYLLLTETIVFGSGSKVALDEVRSTVKDGNIAYHVNKPYHYVIYIICKFIADTFMRFIVYLGLTIVLGYLATGIVPILSINFIFCIPVFLLAVLITGMVRILISLTSFWLEDSQAFQNVYNKVILMFGVLFPIEMFSGVIQKIIRYSPIYGVSYGPAKLAISFSFEMLKDVLISQIVIILVVSILLAIVYGRGVKKLNVNGG